MSVAFLSEISKPRVLVTGSNGFTGHYVAEALQAAGYDVVGLVHENDTPPAHAFSANLLDRAAVRHAVEEARADVVLHLAAISFVAHGDVEEIYRVNVIGTRNLLEALNAATPAPSRIVLASSANVYGNAVIEPITEDAVPAPTNDYSVSKLAMEYMARTWMDKLPIVITRPFNYTGVGQSTRFLIPKIVDHFRRGAHEIELGNTRVWRDFSDVRDVARTYAALVKRAPVGQVYNICSGIGHSLEELLGMMTDIAGYRIRVKVNPAFVRSNEVRRLVGSNVHTCAHIGVQPVSPLRETLEWMYSTP